MQYFFILGSNPVLSAAEIMALLPGANVTVTELYKHALLAESELAVDTPMLMSRLGGTIKIGKIFTEEEPLNPEEAIKIMVSYLLAKGGSGRTMDFGFSIYALERDMPMQRAAETSNAMRNVGLEVKRRLKEAGTSARWVKAQVGPALTSVVVAKNRLIENGAEFVVFVKEGKMRIGVTELVQPFEDFSEADYGRPSRDTLQGMLPPKLARIMINMIHVSRPMMEVTLMDPFCGSGTVVTEALRMGFDWVYGSDKNPAAIDGTSQNIKWAQEQGLVQSIDHVTVFTSDARDISKQIPDNQLDAIVTEPYLGPPRTGLEKRGEIQRQLGELQKLYYECLSSWRRALKNGSPVVMALPVYIMGMEKHGIIASEFEKIGYVTESLLPARLLQRIGVPETRNRGLLYGRNDQHVWREIVRLRLKKD